MKLTTKLASEADLDVVLALWQFSFPKKKMKEFAAARDATEVDVDNYIDDYGIRYLGTARKMPDGTWQCLADVRGALCRVEVSITFQEEKEK